MKNSEADAKRWLRQAENDLDFARLALREGFYSQACFMSHQVAEKALKAIAYFRGDRYVTAHSLLEIILNVVPDYEQLSHLERTARMLDRYYIPTRYPDALPGGVPFETYDQEEAEAAVEDADSIVDVARSIISS
jgi:HEPN domain-containing protein